MAQRIETLKTYIESEALTPEQRAVCFHEGNFVVRACPGSGKTRTSATRFAWRMANWNSRRSGIAVLSFTNVAWREIGLQLQKLGFSPSPAWPHFLGTIDAFVNRYIFLPFGHIVMGCKGHPEIVHEGNELWVEQHVGDPRFRRCRQEGCSPLDFVLSVDGTLVFRRRGIRQQPTKCGRTLCKQFKQAMVRRGFALYSDAMYFGLRVLDNKEIRHAIAARFPEIIVDEAQDTSEVQVKILEALIQAGAKVVLVGDPDQAIYEFHDARPDLFTGFQDRWPTLPLSENFRSSQRICNASRIFSSCDVAPRATGPDRNYPIKPAIEFYVPGREAEILISFEKRLLEHGIDVAHAVVLARRHDLVTKLVGKESTEWPPRVTALAKAMAKATVYRDVGHVGQAHEILMWAMLRLCFDSSSYGPRREAIALVGERDWRRMSWRLLCDLPPSSIALANWGPGLATIIGKFLSDSGWPCTIKLSRTFAKCNAPSAQKPVSDFVRAMSAGTGLTCKVIHQAKGENHEAVMVVCAPARARRSSDLDQWLSQSAREAAERRTAYVAVTRPRKLLVLAVPNGTLADDKKRTTLTSAFDART